MKRSPLRPVSARRATRDAAYPAARRAVYARSGGRCEAEIDEGCTGLCEQTHHIAGRVGPDPHALPNLLGTCGACHAWIHAHPLLAREAGLTRPRTT